MTSLALCAQDLGIEVEGSDIEEIFVTDQILANRKINWQKGFSPKNIDKSVDLVITTGAHGGLKNPEVVFAQNQKIPVITHAEGLKLFSEGKDTLAVCGVGGKTTVASMLANLLTDAGLSPSYAVGVGKIYPLGFPGKYDLSGKHFVCEADEFAVCPGINNAPRFSFLNPKVIVTTNIEHDHPDIYPSLEDTKKAFLEFFAKIPSDGMLVACLDNLNIEEMLSEVKVPLTTYGFNQNSDWIITDLGIQDGQSNFKLKNKTGLEYELKIKLYGDYALRNAAATFCVGNYLGIPSSELIKGIESFEGTQRRFEKVGQAKRGFLIYDDYAHHPKEIISVLGAVKKLYPEKRLIVLFQPHTYSRTRSLFNEFALSFGQADLVGIMDIYASAREIKDPEVNSEKLALEIAKYHPNSYYTMDHKKTFDWVEKNVKKDDLVITLGAGDIFYLLPKFLEI